MSIIINKNTKVLVQGITGNEGRFQTASMLKYGTNIVAGVTPGKRGQTVEGIPVYDKVVDAVNLRGANTSIMFVPARGAKAGALEAIEAGIKILAIITEGIPQLDAIEIMARAKNKGVTVIGPNCPGFINPPQKIKVGILPNHIFQPGSVGIVSRSGTLTYEIAWYITKAGMGQSTCIGIGGDPIIGLDFIQVLEMFKEDPETKGIVIIGEIGGNSEEIAAKFIQDTRYPKPVVAYVAGRMAPSGKRMGHAGAIISGGAGTAELKIKAFNAAGVAVADKPSDIVKLLQLS